MQFSLTGLLVPVLEDCFCVFKTYLDRPSYFPLAPIYFCIFWLNWNYFPMSLLIHSWWIFSCWIRSVCTVWSLSIMFEDISWARPLEHPCCYNSIVVLITLFSTEINCFSHLLWRKKSAFPIDMWNTFLLLLLFMSYLTILPRKFYFCPQDFFRGVQVSYSCGLVLLRYLKMGAEL